MIQLKCSLKGSAKYCRKKKAFRSTDHTQIVNDEEELNDKNALFYLPFYKGEAVGFLKVNIDAPLPGMAENCLELERIYLRKEASGKGIGRELVQLTLRIAEKHCKDLVWLKAMDTSEGPIAFYEKMGFRLVGTHRLKHPLMKEELRGMVIMAKRLKEQKPPSSDAIN